MEAAINEPSDFNDTEDLTIKSIFPEETELALKRLENSFTDVLLQHLNDPPTCKSPMKEQLAQIQHIFRTNPGAADVIKAELAKEGEPLFAVKRMRALAETLLKEINEFMQGYRVLCVTTRVDSEKMWSKYAENHKGIALRIKPNLAKDSKFKLFRPVTYRENRPPLYDETLDFIASLFGDREASLRAMVEKTAYAKTLEWEYENEYRLLIAMREGEEPWDTDPYHPEEITELYLGLAMEKADRGSICGMARAVNQAIAIFGAKRNADGTLGFDRIGLNCPE